MSVETTPTVVSSLFLSLVEGDLTRRRSYLGDCGVTDLKWVLSRLCCLGCAMCTWSALSCLFIQRLELPISRSNRAWRDGGGSDILRERTSFSSLPVTPTTGVKVVSLVTSFSFNCFVSGALAELAGAAPPS